MTQAPETTFRPTEEAKAAFKRMADQASDAMMEHFFAMWEAEGDPRRAGSLAAHAYISRAARVAVFGAHCSGLPPQQELWEAACLDAFNDALRDVNTAFVEAAIEPASGEAAGTMKDGGK